MPTPEECILAGDTKRHERFMCPVLARGGGGVGVSDYRGPTYTVGFGSPDDRPLAADKADNHGGNEINILTKGGQIVKAKKGDGNWQQADNFLTDKEFGSGGSGN